MQASENPARNDPPRDPLSAEGVRDVELGGEMGRRIDITVQNHLRALDLDRDFLRPFHHRRSPAEIASFDRFIGVGMLIDAVVLLAHHTGDQDVADLKNQLVEEILATQDPDWYIGVFEPQDDWSHVWSEYNYHEGTHLVRGLLRDYECGGGRRSLEAARRLADQLMAAWPRVPAGALLSTQGIVEAFLGLHAATGDRRYLDFCAGTPICCG